MMKEKSECSLIYSPFELHYPLELVLLYSNAALVVY